MAIDWDANVLGPLFDIFAEPVTYIPASGAPSFPIDGVFDREYRDVNLIMQEAGVSTTRPVLGVRLAEFPSNAPPAQDDKVFVPSVNATFIVKDSDPDGHGYSRLNLNLVSSP